MKQPSGLSRRQFIRITASAGCLLAGGVGLGLAHKANSPTHVEETQLLLGSIANLTIISTDEERAHTAIKTAFKRMSALEDIFSRFRPQSQLSLLNANGYLDKPSPEFREVLTKSVEYGHLTNSAFDVTVEPVLQLYRSASRSGTLPDQEMVALARQSVDYREIEIQNNRVFLNKPNMAVTLDGIAKGYIIDAGTKVLSEHGFENILVELGGDLHTYGNVGSRPWQISIQQPPYQVNQTASIVAQLTNSAMATSGDYQYTFTSDRRLHHIINPDNGISPDELSSVSVIAHTACDADALSTAVMVMGADAGMTLIESLSDTEALLITKQGNIHYSSKFPSPNRETLSTSI